MDDNEEIKIINFHFKSTKNPLSLVCLGVSIKQIDSFISFTKGAIDVNEFIKLGTEVVDIYFVYIAFDIKTHRLILTYIGDALSLIAFPKSAGILTDNHKKRIKFLIQIKNKNIPKSEILNKIGSVDYQPPKQHGGHIMVTEDEINLNLEAENLLSKHYPLLYKESIFNLYRILYYECELLGITLYSLFKSSGSDVLFSVDDNGNFVDCEEKKLSEVLYLEITNKIPPISFIYNTIYKIGYKYWNFSFFLKIIPYEWDEKNILKHIKFNKELSKIPFEVTGIINTDNNTNILIQTDFGEIPLPFPLFHFLEYLLPIYQETIDNTKNEIIKRHKEIREDIKEWLKNKFEKYSAKKPKGFVEWILNNKDYPTLELSYDVYIRNTPMVNVWGDLHIDFPRWDVEILEDDLIRYCETRVQQLNAKLNFPTNLTKNDIYESILNACIKLQSNILYRQIDENSRNTFIRDILSMKHNIKDQSLYGESSSGKSNGELDLIIFSDTQPRNPVTICEGINVKSLDKGNLGNHLKKLESGYDKWGLKEKYLLVYSNINCSFSEFVEKYKDFIENYSFEFVKEGDVEDINTSYSNIRVYKTTHKREEKSVCLYHFLIKMP